MITEPAPRLTASVPASFRRRVGSHLVDAVAVPVVLLVLAAGLARTRHPLAAVGVLALGSLAFLVFAVWNSGYRQGRTGQSLGKRLFGIRLTAGTGAPIGFGRAVLRQVAHLIDALPFGIGYLWPLWDERRQTFADKVCGTVVVVADRPAGGP